MDKPRITRSVLTDEAGRLLERSVQRGPKPPPWRNLTRDEDELTMDRPMAFLYPRDGSPIVPLRQIEIVVSTTRFVVGEECSIRVTGELDPGETVGILINGSRYEVDSDDMVLLDAAVPGIYSVVMDDSRYWSERPSYTIMAVQGG